MAAEADKYILTVTVGDTYDKSKHEQVHVNSSPVKLSTDQFDATVHVRIKDYRGLPKGSPSDCAYFHHPSHTSDRYSIEFTFTPKQNINGNDLVFGNDFDHPVRDRLPPLFDKAFSYVKWWIDPGLYGEFYGDEPYLYGPLLSSMNVVRVGQKNTNGQDKDAIKQPAAATEEEDEEGDEHTEVLEEGADGDGQESRKSMGVPNDMKSRRKHFLTEQHLKDFEFEAGREYKFDFFNQYLDFNDFSLKLPILTINILSRWDGQPLRYVLRNRKTDELLFCIMFTLLPADQAGQEAAPEGMDAIAAVRGEGSVGEAAKGKDGNKREDDDDVD